MCYHLTVHLAEIDERNVKRYQTHESCLSAVSPKTCFAQAGWCMASHLDHVSNFLS